MKILDANRHSAPATSLLKSLNEQVIGQEEAKTMLVDMVENYQAGFSDPKRPAGVALFLGPTGTGKTQVILSACRALFGEENACLKVDCGEYQHSHEIAKLVGSPPGLTQ